MIIEEKLCLRCGHKWLPRSDKIPVMCPACKTQLWNKKKQVHK